MWIMGLLFYYDFMMLLVNHNIIWNLNMEVKIRIFEKKSHPMCDNISDCFTSVLYIFCVLKKSYLDISHPTHPTVNVEVGYPLRNHPIHGEPNTMN
jgi:hypothetical protein